MDKVLTPDEILLPTGSTGAIRVCCAPKFEDLALHKIWLVVRLLGS